MMKRYFLTISIFLIGILSVSCMAIDLVEVDKSENKMYLWKNNQMVKTYHVAFGSSPKGHKEQEGDNKTPEGRYILDYKKEDSAFYRSMHINYPNLIDTDNAIKKGVSPGGLIMIHGQKNQVGWQAEVAQKYNWTKGCIALTNPEMDEFMSLVKVGTPIEIQW